MNPREGTALLAERARRRDLVDPAPRGYDARAPLRCRKGCDGNAAHGSTVSGERLEQKGRDACVARVARRPATPGFERVERANACAEGAVHEPNGG